MSQDAYAIYIDQDAYLVEVTADSYEIIISDGAPLSAIWNKKTIYVADSANVLQSDFFAGDVADIIFMNEQPKMWANNGTSLGEITKDGDELDFTAVGGIQGWLSFEYRNLP